MVAVIGSGPAGVSAALYIKRANIPVIVFTNHKSNLLKAKEIENYYGTGKITGQNLYTKGIDSLKALKIDIIEDEITNIEVSEHFTLKGLNHDYSADSVILATGTNIAKPNIKGIKEFEGKGISYCATCDGFFYRDKNIALIGNSKYAKEEYDYLKGLTDKITVFTNGLDSQYFDNYIKDNIKEIDGNNVVEKIILNNDKVYNIDGIFIANEYPDSSTLARKIGILEKNSSIIVDDNMETNIKGIFACGDNTPGIKQVSKATFEGMKAGMSAIKYYKNKCQVTNKN